MTTRRLPFLAGLLALMTLTAGVGRGGPPRMDTTTTPVLDGVRATADLDTSQHHANVGGSDGAGLCVYTSAWHACVWQDIPELYGFRDWMRLRPGGSYPEKFEKTLNQFCAEKGVTPPAYIQHTAGDVAFLELALKTGRMPCVTYAGYDGFYRDRYGRDLWIDHMVNLVHLDADRACIIDNNRPGKWVWMTRADFLTRWKARGGGWAVVFLAAPPAPYPVPPVKSFAALPGCEGCECGCSAGGPCRCGEDGPKMFGQCPGGRCPIRPAVVPAGPDEPFEWRTFPDAPDAQFLYQGGRLVGGAMPDGWHPANGRPGGLTWEPSGSPPIDPPTLPAGQVAGDLPTGVVSEKIQGEAPYRITKNGQTRVVSWLDVAVELSEGLTDDSKKFNLAVVGDKAFQARVKADLAQADPSLVARLHVKFYDPTADAWAVSQFKLAPGLRLRKPAVSRVGDDLGAVGFDGYDAQKLAELVQLILGPKPTPPAPPAPVDPANPKPAPTPAPGVPSFPGWLWLIVGGVLVLLFKKSPATPA